MSYCDVTYLTFCNVRANLNHPSKMCKMAKMSAKHAYRLWEMLEIDFDWNKCRFQVEIKTISSPFILFTFKVMSIKCEIKSHTFAQQKNENVYLKEKKEIIWLYLSDWMTSNTLVLSLLSRNLHQMTIFHLQNGEFRRNRRTCCYHTDDLSCMDMSVWNEKMSNNIFAEIDA